MDVMMATDKVPPHSIKRARMWNVAKAAHVSVASLSRRFSEECERLSRDLTLRIEYPISRLGYRPDHMAAGSRGASKRLTGALVAALHNPYSPDPAGREPQYTLLACDTDGDDLLERQHLAIIGSLLWITTPHTPVIDHLADSGCNERPLFRHPALDSVRTFH